MVRGETITGPSARMILRQDGAGWTCQVDARSVGTYVVGMGGTVGPEASRDAVLDRAASWMRRVFAADLHPKQEAWLSSLAPAEAITRPAPTQPDLFAA